MDSMERIFERSKSYHTAAVSDVLSENGASTSEEFVWQHSVCVLELTRWICAEHDIDTTDVEKSLTAAALFHDAGWVAMRHSGQMPAVKLLSRPGDMTLRKGSEKVLRSESTDLLDRNDLESACRYILDMAVTRPETAVARALSDAENLEEMGLIGVIRQIRLGLVTGKSARGILAGWHRQQEYHYWEARIGTGLQFEISRRLARDRLERMGAFFDLLRREMDLDDLGDISSRLRTRSKTGKRLPETT